MANIGALLIQTIHILANLISFAIIGRVLLSWVTPGRERSTRIGEILHDITEPIINIARLLPHKIGMIDLAPVITLFAIDIVSRIVIRLLIYLFA